MWRFGLSGHIIIKSKYYELHFLDLIRLDKSNKKIVNICTTMMGHTWLNLVSSLVNKKDRHLLVIVNVQGILFCFIRISLSTCSQVRHDRRAVTGSPAVENTRSLATDVTGTFKNFWARCANKWYVIGELSTTIKGQNQVACFLHICN